VSVVVHDADNAQGHRPTLQVSVRRRANKLIRRPTLRPATSARQVMVRFVLAGLVAFVMVAAGGAVGARRAAESEAIDDAQQRTVMLADHVVTSAATDALVAGDQRAISHLDTLVREHVLGHDVLRVKIWTTDGTVVYSDEPALIGRHYTLAAEERAAIESGRLDAATTNLARPENRFERGAGPMLEVYLTIHTPSGRPLLFETYQSRSQVAARGTEIWRDFMPSVVGGLLLLVLLMCPLVWTLARQLEAARNEREGLLSRALHASSTERRRIASHLHDGIVQSLAGVSYALAGIADKLTTEGRRADAEMVNDAAVELRQDVRGLRSLLVEIYPPGLRGAGFQTAIADLTAPLISRGIEVDLDIEGGDELQETVQVLLFQIAQESLRNIVRHSRATTAAVKLERVDALVVFVVSDNGLGFDMSPVHRRSSTNEGHLGLPLLAGAVAEADGTLTVESAPGSGTTITARVPLP
jgi:two-component system, NarL family, sensor kinase